MRELKHYFLHKNRYFSGKKGAKKGGKGKGEARAGNPGKCVVSIHDSIRQTLV